MNDDELRDALQLVERPVALPGEFTERVLSVMVGELEAERRGAAVPKRRRLPAMRLRPTLGVAAALVVVILAATLVMVTREAPSALAALNEARAQFRTLPAYHARTNVSANENADNPDFETNWESEDWYRDGDTWRTTILASDFASIGQPGDYQVLAGGLYGQYKTDANVFTVTPVADRSDGRPNSPAHSFDPSLQWWSAGGPDEPARPSDRFFEESCLARRGTYIGREATRLHCPAKPRDIELWLDKETGMLLRISVFDTIREITSIDVDPDVPAGTFEVRAPEGAKKRWGGNGAPPADYQVALGDEVAARYQVVEPGIEGGLSIAAVTRAGIWLIAIRCGEETRRCDHQLLRVDPKTGNVVATIDPPELAFISDVEELDGQVWVAMAQRRGGGVDGSSVAGTAFLQRVDLNTNRLTGPPIETGQSGGSLLAVGSELWTSGGATREVRVGPATSQYQNVARVNPRTGAVTQIDVDAAVGVLVDGDGLVWVSTRRINERNPRQPDLGVVAIDPTTNAIVRQITTPAPANLVAFAGGQLYAVFGLTEGGSERWLIGSLAARGETFVTEQVGRAGDEIAGLGVLVGGSLWLPSFGRDEVLKVDPTTLKVTGTVATGRGPAGIGVGLGSVWVTHVKDGTLVRIDFE